MMKKDLDKFRVRNGELINYEKRIIDLYQLREKPRAMISICNNETTCEIPEEVHLQVFDIIISCYEKMYNDTLTTLKTLVDIEDEGE